MNASQRPELIQRSIPHLDISKQFSDIDIRKLNKELLGDCCTLGCWAANMQLIFSRFTPQSVSSKIAPSIIRSCVMHELKNFHPSRRRLAAEVFDFDRASVHLLARFKLSLSPVTEPEARTIAIKGVVRRA